MSNQFGYCCINTTLQKRGITTSRTMRLKTFKEKGIKGAADLALQNCQDLVEVIKWNNQNNIKVFRITSDLFPWASEYKIEQMPHYEQISKTLKKAGDLARTSGQRLSFHPGPFNCLASSDENVVANCVKDLSIHGIQADLLGLPRDHSAKINIHIGAAYGDRQKSLDTWCNNFEKLPESVRSRMTIENDDRPNLYSTKMLYESVYKRHKIPIVFDGFHFKTGPKDVSYEESFMMAYESWPEGIRPMCHHSTSKKDFEDKTCTSVTAHSDFIHYEFDSCGKSVDVALEAKAKELALFKYKQNYLTA